MGIFKKTLVEREKRKTHIYALNNMSVWYIDGEIWLYYGCTRKEFGEPVAFDKRKANLSHTDNIVPENFFDDFLERFKEFFANFCPLGANSIKEDLTMELRDLYAHREEKHNLIYDTDMFSARQSDLYNYRECFPSDWEDCFEKKYYYFVMEEWDFSKTHKYPVCVTGEDGKDVLCENGYFEICACSLLDAKLYFEEKLVENSYWRGDTVWCLKHTPLDCAFIIPAVTKKDLERMKPEVLLAIQKDHEQYGKFSDRTFFGSYNADEMTMEEIENGLPRRKFKPLKIINSGEGEQV